MEHCLNNVQFFSIQQDFEKLQGTLITQKKRAESELGFWFSTRCLQRNLP